MRNKETVASTLRMMAEMHGKQMSPAAGMMMATDLSKYPDAVVLEALKRCRMELRTFPSIGDIVARIQISDGRPGVEEAWSLCPVSEEQSTVWTTEVRDAFFSGAAALLERDEVAARMAFKESYAKLISDSRASGRPLQWEVSLGNDKIGRERALVNAVRKNRIDAAHAKKLLPDCSFASTRVQPQLGGDDKRQLEQILEE